MEDLMERNKLSIAIPAALVSIALCVAAAIWNHHLATRQQDSPKAELQPFISGTWTCEDQSSATRVDAEAISGDFGDKIVSGSFTSPTTLELKVQSKDGSAASENIRCWQQQ
ncbi:MAG: hypothetical protein WC813_04085 [Patescibacteria group bacterium]